MRVQNDIQFICYGLVFVTKPSDMLKLYLAMFE